MQQIHPQFITDKDGKRISVILSVEEFKMIVEALEDLEDIRMYNEATTEDDSERISLAEVLKTIEENK